jgi:SAM-dependent methyltransferase
MFSPAAERNKQAILDVLVQVLPERGSALEIASGTGQHVAWFAAGLPHWTWQPTEADPEALNAMAASLAAQGASPVRAPLQLDVMAPRWLQGGAQAGSGFDLIYCANMLHIAPWATCAALMQGAARHLSPGGVLITYGPYLEHGVPTSPGNLAFDASLRANHPDWGIRQLADVTEQAQHAGLALLQRHAMPSNNLLLVWGRPT